MIRLTIEKHTVAFPSKLVAQTGGAHIYNIELTEDRDNGTLVGRGEFLDLDLYKQAAVPKFEGVIRKKARNGNWYIEVTAPTDALFIHESEIIAEEGWKDLEDEANFFNGKGTVVAGYELHVGDTFEVSDAGFIGDPKAGAKVTGDATGKYKVAAAA